MAERALDFLNSTEDTRPEFGPEPEPRPFLDPAGPPPAPEAPVTPPVAASLPRTRAAMDAALSPAMPLRGQPTIGQAIMSAPARARAAYVEAGMEGDVPLDIESGLSGWERLMYEIRGSQEAEIEALTKKHPDRQIRLHPISGIPIVRIPDPDNPGKEKDLQVDESRMTARDLIGLIGVAPEIAGSLIGFRTGRRIPGLGKKGGPLGFGRDVAAETVGSGVAGVAEDVALETVDPSGRVNLPRSLKERGEQAAVEGALNVGGQGTLRFFRFAVNPFGGPRQVQFDALAAREYLKGRTGINIELSAAEASGNPYFAAQEAFLSQQPGGKRIREFRDRRRRQILDMQRTMTGELRPEEEIGQEAIETIQAGVAPLKSAARSAKAALQEAGEKEISGLVAATTSPTPAPRIDVLGKTVRDKITALRDSAKAESSDLYNKARSLPGGTGRVLAAGDALAADAEALLKQVPSVEVTKTLPTGVVGPTGAPLTRDVRVVELMRKWIPPEIVNRLENLAALKGKDATFSLSDLQQLRRDVYDEIGKTQGVPDPITHYLAEIGEMLTKGLERETGKIPGGALKKALQEANKHYKEKVLPFNRVGVTELFRRADEPGFIFDPDVISRVTTDPGRFQVIKETLGATSPEFTSLKRFIADDLLRRSSIDGETLNAKSLFDNLKHFSDKYKTISDDVFGPDIKRFLNLAKVLEVGQAEKISYDELQTILSTKTGTLPQLQELLRAQKAKDAAFKNKIVKAVAADELDEAAIQPSEFVNRFLDAGTPEEIKQVLGHISSDPVLLEKIRNRTVQRLFANSSRPLRAEHVARVLGDEPAEHAGAAKLADQLADPKIRAVLGPQMTKDMGELAKVLAAPEALEDQFGRTGMFSMANSIGTLIRKGPLKYVTGVAVKDAIVSFLITNPVLRQWAARIPRNDPAAWQVVFTSAPFMEMMIEQFGEGTGADTAIRTLKSAVDKWTAEQQPNQSQSTGNRAAERFLQSP